MKATLSLIAAILVLTVLVLGGCATSAQTRQEQQQTGMLRSPEYYRTFGPGAEQPPDYGERGSQ